MEALSRWAKKLGTFVDSIALPQEKLPRRQVVVDVESITEQKREWIEQQQSTTTKDLAVWPEHLIEGFVIVGLPPDMEITQIAEDLCEKEHRREDAAAAEARRSDQTPASSSVSEPPWPAYEPAVLFKYPQRAAQGQGPGMELSDRELCCLCFPNKVPPRKLKRSPSWSALNKVVYHRQAFNQDGDSFIFMLKVGLGLPLYGVCCYVEEVLHRPPLMAKDNFPSCRGPFRQCLIAAPRCYCLLSRYPFFPLHFSVLREILDLERLNRVVHLNAEMGGGLEQSTRTSLTTRMSAAGAAQQPSSSRQPPVPELAAKAAAAEGGRQPPAAAAGATEEDRDARAAGADGAAAAAAAAADDERLSARGQVTLQHQQQNEALFQRISESYSSNSKHVEQSYKRRTYYRASTASSSTLAAPTTPPQHTHALHHRGGGEQLAASGSDGAATAATEAALQAGWRVAGLRAAALGRVSEAASSPTSPTVAEEGGGCRTASAPMSPECSMQPLPTAISAPAPGFEEELERAAERNGSGSAAASAGAGGAGEAAVPGDESPQRREQQEEAGGAGSGGDGSPEREDLDTSFERMSAAGTRSFHFHPQKILDQVLAADIPTPGDPLVIELTGMSSFPRSTTLVFTRPQLPGRFTVIGPQRQLLGYAEAELTQCLQAWTISAAARLLSLDNLLLMLSAALLEEQVVVFCANIATCSAVVLALVPLLRPFSLQGLLLPVTPSSLMSFIDAPVPFVLGLQHNTPDIQARCTHLVQVNVDQDQVLNAEGLPHLPGLKQLRAALLPHYQTLQRARGAVSKAKFPGLSSEEEEASARLCELLHEHLRTLVGDIRPHVITNVNLGKRTGMLMKTSLTESFPRSSRSFISAFLETQLFAVWCDQVISTQIEMAAQ